MPKVNPESTSSATPATSEVARFWRNLDEKYETPAARLAAQNEFEPEAVDDRGSSAITRRGFLGLLGGATAAMATAACTSSDRKIVPYTKRPQEIVPGVANYYSSTFPEGDRSYSVLVKTREGRPIHITGNDEDPLLGGKTTLRAMADVMGLYDPERLRSPTHEGRPSTWAEAEQALASLLQQAKREGKPVLLLSGASDSPTRAGLLAELRAQLPSLEHLIWEPGRCDSEQVAAEAAYAVPVHTRLRLAQAKVIVALGSDFLNGDDPAAIADFTSQRRPNEPVSDMSRLWVFEGPLTITGGNADQRFNVKPSRLASVAYAIAAELHSRKALTLPAGVELVPVPKDFAQQQGIPTEAWEMLLVDLERARDKAVVIAGETMPADAQLAAHLLNTMLGSRCVQTTPAQRRATLADVAQAVARMDSGQYLGAIIWGVNPLYAFPDADRIKAAFAKVPNRIWIGTVPDETAEHCAWNLPENHWLESFGDHGGPTRLTLQQPAIAPLYDTRQGEEILCAALKALRVANVTDFQTRLRDRWQKEIYPADSPVPFERFMNSVLHDGLVQREVAGPDQPRFQATKLLDSARRAFEPSVEQGFELVVHPSAQLYDGRYANNGWLQELPDPVTKNTWGNPLTLSIEDAKQLKLENGDLVELAVDQTRATLPVLIQPGQTAGVLSLALGYGRAAGAVARGVGKNAFPFLSLDGNTANVRTHATLKKIGKSVRLPLTQRHHRLDGRDIVRSLTLSEFDAAVAKPRKKVQLTTLYAQQSFPDHKWGMVIDLAACTGCSACVIACQSENNIATVGAEQVERGREMHWLRIDSYYEGSEANPRVVHQPMLCQHCDHAPCENVCPVNATNHSSDGLNQMVYNRCVGTRYCANNCPYKVRRFNFFDYTSEATEPENLKYNPEVTVRPRGVMEKCTFCVQRIEDARV
ncbi:MAG TPA: TAT-variant-translocated molybdopterin oxidoreductase, partial [Polyangiaceae bacterium]|nr:TAT-variant-translocated molybdopterin oxidoreductase [Polyangiaceae bacterium]